MYRCYGCDMPSQQGCATTCPSQVEAVAKGVTDHPDPWGWKDEPVKLDIQSGMKVREHESAC